jgi:hypothetical protein
VNGFCEFSCLRFANRYVGWLRGFAPRARKASQRPHAHGGARTLVRSLLALATPILAGGQGCRSNPYQFSGGRFLRITHQSAKTPKIWFEEIPPMCASPIPNCELDLRRRVRGRGRARRRLAHDDAGGIADVSPNPGPRRFPLFAGGT